MINIVNNDFKITICLNVLNQSNENIQTYLHQFISVKDSLYIYVIFCPPHSEITFQSIPKKLHLSYLFKQSARIYFQKSEETDLCPSRRKQIIRI